MATPEKPIAIETPAEPGRPAKPAWSGRTRGGYIGNWFFIQLIRRLGVWPAYLWLAFVAAYFVVAAGGPARASADFLERVFGPLGRWRRHWYVYRHFLAFGVTLVDRVAVLMGRRKIRCVVEGGELFKPFLDRGKGVILVGAHHGCWELGGHFLTDYNVPVNLVVIDRELAGIQKLFDSASDSRRFRILTTDDNPLRGLPILAALRRGEIVALLGDRSFGSSDVEVDFLGGKASIPIGPYRLAAASGAPLFHVSVVREKFGCYRFSAFAPEFISRHEARTNPDAAPDCARRYARRLESVVRQYPFQWANFFAFWEPKSGTARASSAKPSPC